MKDHGAIGKFNEWLGQRERLVVVRTVVRSPSIVWVCSAPPEDFSRMGRTRGRSRVPYPPTRMSAMKISIHVSCLNCSLLHIPFILNSIKVNAMRKVNMKSLEEFRSVASSYKRMVVVTSVHYFKSGET